MYRLAFAPLLFSAGCLLYTGDLNHPPDISVTVQQTSTNKGTPISFAVSGTDREDSPDQLAVDIPKIAAADGQPLDANCDYYFSGVGIGGFTVTFYRVGMFSVTSTIHDSQGAVSSPSTVMIKVENAPPEFDAQTTLTPVLPINACKSYIAGQGIPIQLSKPASDADANSGLAAPGCPGVETLTYDWTVTPPPAGRAVFTPYRNGACVPMSGSDPSELMTTSTDDVCFWPLYGTTGVSATYSVKVSVSDGGNQPASLSLAVDVQSDGPPCVTGVQPPAGSYVVDPNSPAPFDTLTVATVADDLDSFPGSTQLELVWSLWRESDPAWRIIPISGNQYSPDYSIFGVGEKVRIRAEAVDRTGTRAGCDPMQDFCTVASCAATTCNQWTTWDLELR